MSYIVALFVLIILGIFDGHISSVAAMSLTFVLGLWSVNSIKNREEREQGGKVFGIVFSVYVISAFIASQSFLNGQWFYVSDSMKYIENFSNIRTWNWEEYFFTLEKQYFYFDDNNGLFNTGLALWSYVANHFLDGTSVYYLGLFQTLFGVLASLEVFKIFLIYFEPHNASKYTCLFALLSLFHIYSVLIIRDIVIAYFYLFGLRKIIGKSMLSDIWLLLLVMIITMGIRLYTGLFFGAFIMFWAYKLVRDKKYKHYRIILVPIIIIGTVFVGSSLLTAELMEGTEHEFEHYEELNTVGSGFISRISSLPAGLRHLVVLFFSQLPLSSFHWFTQSTCFSNFYISILIVIYLLFGFVIFYGLMYYCFVKGFFKTMDFNEKWILIIMLIFVALTLGTHIDVRRSMEAIPFFYLFYMITTRKIDSKQWHKVNSSLIMIGVLISLAYGLFK